MPPSATALASAFLTGFGITLGLIVAIGAQNAFVLRQGLRREHVLPVVAFCALADTLLVMVGVWTMGSLRTTLPALAPALTLGGALFLFGYGLLALRRALKPHALLAAQGAPASASRARVLAQTAAFTLLNPHVYVDTVLLVGSVGAQEAGAARISFVTGTALASTAWFALLGIGARLLAPLFARPVAWRWLDALVGAMMLALGALLLRQA
ncbi:MULTISPECIES: LysE/ArgO family amino acid transporter [unclassified Variovorax]|uniref:LysE/ArgO family amino acid transporter n=1 Tax=unclassified Variovorax TaxID=663243 RepID=UPI001BD536E5|nr:MULTISPECIES: LysE/ArgO family amino acid transporter [unclassified Variovorax]